MRCTNCDAELAPNARFCTTCGTPVVASPAPTPPGIGGSESQSMADVYDNRPGERIDLPDPAVVGAGQGASGLQYKIIGTTMQAVVIELPPSQTVFSERGGMSWMSANINMATNMEGGLGGAFKRMFSGESIFMVSFTSQGGNGIVGFSAEFPGKIVPLNLGSGQQMICQKDAFMCAERSVTLDIHFRRKLGAGFFGGEGFVMQKLTGPGLAFVELDGEIVEYTLEANQMLKVDTGHVAMYEPTVQFDVEMVRGFKNILFGGEGLFLATLRGPGRVWLQTMPAMNLAKKIAQYLPSSGSSSGGGNGPNINLGNLFGE
ncbi:TIGR00266 family protein [Oscillochloris sp. ZM17-4]|uniref:TIGR00266 family protein n=1 Tax=Oscillochloris sp. ZM17-4 TaxID=2866714 RepID=UPI001C7330B7|nr:TIGR00266 family protein [Oscillochloris sp. ZM17-4]MBX0328068.1 TIGR00266 family protein [Oscillochloris sp. ZM17-4]